MFSEWARFYYVLQATVSHEYSDTSDELINMYITKSGDE